MKRNPDIDADYGYASASDGLESYDFWKTTEPDDRDDIYFSTWEEAEARAAEMKHNAEVYKSRAGNSAARNKRATDRAA